MKQGIDYVNTLLRPTNIQRYFNLRRINRHFQTVGREEYIKEQQKQLEEEKKKISENQSLIAEEKQHLMGELDYRARQLNEEVNLSDCNSQFS